MKKLFLILNLSLLGLACSKSGKDDDPSFQFAKGFGRSEERPEGVPFVWPVGLRLVGEPGTGDECFDAIYKQKRLFGHGGGVAVCLNFYNETDKPITLKLPPGLMFVSKTVEAQNGLLLTVVTIEVPPKEQYLAQLNMMCVNPPRSSSSGYEYEAQPIVTDHPALRPLIDLLANKRCNYEYYGGDYDSQLALEIGATISVAAQDLIYGKPIHKQEQQAIAAIPEK
ncbi:hypothetical protein SAMN05216327_10294 [Dyadobacter sp. SG02]|uniref:hypothetical protein n=1 Tax=Dyadobacter sp. SG02 TaxID=1855291 RepID=UPI0008D2A3CB|nr:hypothetical protein [Dyadobacter sp. SG02]SEI50643.1 hypothetical protein SAMN05216327_10294 [Dyadobacter sp. SG02]